MLEHETTTPLVRSNKGRPGSRTELSRTLSTAVAIPTTRPRQTVKSNRRQAEASHRERDRQAAIQQLHRVVLSEPEPHAIIRLAAQVYNDASDFEKLRLAIERRANG